ncbi:MAG: type II secretion system protein, partial [Opitutales bacterium]
LTVIAIIGILASILIPTVGRVREAARRTVDASNIRQIGQASLIYANDNRERLPPRGPNQGLSGTGNTAGQLQAAVTPSTHAIAAALARSGGLNDASIWISSSDKTPNIETGLTTILTGAGTAKTIDTDFANSPLSFAYIAGRTTSMPSSAPIAFTRGLASSGSPTAKWMNNSTISVYGEDGGHIVFLGGNVQFYKDVGTAGPNGTGIFTYHSAHASAGDRTNNITHTWGSSEAGYSKPGIPNVTTETGQAGS